jgi:alkanesulfonate monooxygenase SsuD/methylene tetrahydromethanopterin reductase-like flavin-dependent oxidoreductase (luciferase family)
MAGVAVGATRRCAVGTGVLQLPLRHPAVVAKAATTLQQASGGRFLLGIGSGEHRREYELAGADFDGRGRAIDDGLAALRELWAPGDTPYEQRPAPATMPLWFGGRGRATMRRVATWGRGWLPIFVSPDRLAEGVAGLEPLLVTAGRTRADLTIGATVVAAVTDPSWSRADALRWMAELWGVPAERFDRHLVAGSPEQCAEVLHEYVAKGADHVTVLPASPEPVATYVALTDAFRPGRVPGPDQLAGV